MIRKIPATKTQLANLLERIASRTLCRFDPEKLNGHYAWAHDLANVREAYELLGQAESFWRLARAFGFVPTILYVHKSVTCFDQPIFAKEDCGQNVTCPRCLRLAEPQAGLRP